ncbi:TIGR03086 family metal-binding protein [Spongisporangium articulatum]|uniref:TIGR03086 family metal-binding protein n=1 Tax=Spongisporangium articulatum TaxID=3362603 RepID=A0ABW8AKE7_9ACTN
MTTEPETQEATPDAAELIQPVLADLSNLVASVPPEAYDQPTPCPGMSVGDVRNHIVGWLTYFAQALADPSGEQPRVDPKETRAPEDPTEAAAKVREAADSIRTSVAAGHADGPVKLSSELPGSAVLGMMVWEYQMHGWDLARGANRPWNPPAAASEASLAFAPNMLSDEYRGEGKDFGPVVEVPEDAPALDRLLGFSGRDPDWAPQVV